jgi:hypothetical protein
MGTETRRFRQQTISEAEVTTHFIWPRTAPELDAGFDLGFH